MAQLSGLSLIVAAGLGRICLAVAVDRDAGHWPVDSWPAWPPVNRNVSKIVHPWGTPHLWGFPDYAKDLDKGLKTWEELARQHGHLGRECNAETERKALAMSSSAREAPAESARCPGTAETSSGARRQKTVGPVNEWTWREVLCTVLIVATAVLSAAAGMGGGGVYVPLLLLLLGLSAKEAVPLSQAMIVGGASINIIMFCGDRHPHYPQRPKIDYDVVVMLNPGLSAGVTLGVLANIVSPQWLIVLVLLVTLALALQKSLSKGLQQWRKESEALVEPVQGTSESDGQQKGIDLGSFAKLAGRNRGPLVLIAGCWLAFLVFIMVKAPLCSALHWAQLAGLMAACWAFTEAGAKAVSEQASLSEGGLTWTPQTLRLYPLLAVVAGFLGGFLGIGGGIIMGPLLLELGLPPEVGQATTAMFVFLSSSIATIHFMILGKAMPAYALWFTIWVLVATIAGQTAIDYMLRRLRRSSPIILSIAAIVAGSLVMMTVVGVLDVATDLRRGADMGFVPITSASSFSGDPGPLRRQGAARMSSRASCSSCSEALT
eukprot:CAMPEP_0170574190 /NCGR_PEP_ID=MMETSP0224-20130122/3169_1 /TAXON_ID=285029 /ORGANISM="Togula jolla, Strain CCCM 725" /LENGTH=545 /DNA_ID=CAMNT_0010896833 /DNA_START=172 /DNA_END=1808 /DNA_ORIENTATION=+